MKDEKRGIVQIFDIEGKLISSSELDMKRYFLNISNYSPGLYFINVIINNNSQSVKFIKL